MCRLSHLVAIVLAALALSACPDSERKVASSSSPTTPTTPGSPSTPGTASDVPAISISEVVIAPGDPNLPGEGMLIILGVGFLDPDNPSTPDVTLGNTPLNVRNINQDGTELVTVLPLDFPSGEFRLRVEQRVPGMQPNLKLDNERVAIYDLTVSANDAGPRGPQGESGPAGLAGTEVGPPGEAGPKGLTGPSGETGPTGVQGETGVAGPLGRAGPEGLPGRLGIPGVVGATGPAGEAGPGGEPGPAGPQGEIGIAGPAGAVGATGLLGPPGAQGTPGSIGPRGAAGPRGNLGPAGAQGDTGAPGPRGPVGPRGLQGPVGAQGNMGAAGPVGIIGPRGDSGPVGAAGATGLAGPPGAAGPAGLQGPPGSQGAQGQIGAQGPDGGPCSFSQCAHDDAMAHHLDGTLIYSCPNSADVEIQCRCRDIKPTTIIGVTSSGQPRVTGSNDAELPDDILGTAPLTIDTFDSFTTRCGVEYDYNDVWLLYEWSCEGETAGHASVCNPTADGWDQAAYTATYQYKEILWYPQSYVRYKITLAIYDISLDTFTLNTEMFWIFDTRASGPIN